MRRYGKGKNQVDSKRKQGYILLIRGCLMVRQGASVLDDSALGALSRSVEHRPSLIFFMSLYSVCYTKIRKENGVKY